MSDELHAKIHGAAASEARAFAADSPCTPDDLAFYVTRVRRRRTAQAAGQTTGALAVVGVIAFGLTQPWQSSTPVGNPTPTADPAPTSPAYLKNSQKYDPSADADDWRCGATIPATLPTIPQDMLWHAEVLTGEVAAGDGIELSVTEGSRTYDQINTWAWTSAELIAVQDGVVVGRSRADRDLVHRPLNGTGELQTTQQRELLDTCGTAPVGSAFVPVGTYDLYVLQGYTAVLPGNAEESAAGTGTPVEVLAVSGPTSLTISDLVAGEPPTVAVESAGSYETAIAVAGAVPDSITGMTWPGGPDEGFAGAPGSTTALFTEPPQCGSPAQLTVFPFWTGAAGFWDAPKPAVVTLAPLDAHDAPPEGSLALEMAIGRPLDSADGYLGYGDGLYLLDASGRVAAAPVGDSHPVDSGGSNVDDGSARTHFVVADGCSPQVDGGWEPLPTGTYRVLHVTSILVDQEYWRTIRWSHGLGGMTAPDLLFAYEIVGEVTLP